jgi:hypothetical protein
VRPTPPQSVHGRTGKLLLSKSTIVLYACVCIVTLCICLYLFVCLYVYVYVCVLFSVENYEGDGVLFQGNVRGKDPSVSYAKMRERLKVMMRSCSCKPPTEHVGMQPNACIHLQTHMPAGMHERARYSYGVLRECAHLRSHIRACIRQEEAHVLWRLCVCS